jgi:hypothetical protein
MCYRRTTSCPASLAAVIAKSRRARDQTRAAHPNRIAILSNGTHTVSNDPMSVNRRECTREPMIHHRLDEQGHPRLTSRNDTHQHEMLDTARLEGPLFLTRQFAAPNPNRADRTADDDSERGMQRVRRMMQRERHERYGDGCNERLDRLSDPRTPSGTRQLSLRRGYDARAVGRVNPFGLKCIPIELPIVHASTPPRKARNAARARVSRTLALLSLIP